MFNAENDSFLLAKSIKGDGLGRNGNGVEVKINHDQINWQEKCKALNGLLLSFVPLLSSYDNFCQMTAYMQSNMNVSCWDHNKV